MKDQIATVLVCPTELLREGVSRMLEGSPFELVAAVSSTEAIRPLAGSETPTLAVFVVLGDDGRAGYRNILARFPEIRIAVLAEGLARRQIALMSDSGVSGFLHHTISRDNLLKSLHLVLDGMCVLPSPLLYQDLAMNREARPTDGEDDTENKLSPAIMECLSKRELGVLEGLAAGASNKVIARRLGITDSTVKVHVKSIFRKTKMTNRVQLALWASHRVDPLLSEHATVVAPPAFHLKLASRVMRDSRAEATDLALTA